MNNTMNQTEAGAVVLASVLRKAKTQLERMIATRKASGAAMDWLLEQGYVTIRPANGTRQFSGGEPCAYLTPAGKAWQAQSGGLHMGLSALFACTNR